MLKIKFTKGELKRQRDSLSQYLRYLPILQVKKQQLQMEILHQVALLEEREHIESVKTQEAGNWIGLLAADPDIDIRCWLKPEKVCTVSKNVAGIDLLVFQRLEFAVAEYDLFIYPLWVDVGIEALRLLISLRKEIEIIKQGIEVLRQELCITTQRLNLFEKIKIPDAKEAIRLIKIYLGDQMANAVGRSKIAKSKMEESVLEEVVV